LGRRQFKPYRDCLTHRRLQASQRGQDFDGLLGPQQPPPPVAFWGGWKAWMARETRKPSSTRGAQTSKWTLIDSQAPPAPKPLHSHSTFPKFHVEQTRQKPENSGPQKLSRTMNDTLDTPRFELGVTPVPFRSSTGRNRMFLNSSTDYFQHHFLDTMGYELQSPHDMKGRKDRWNFWAAQMDHQRSGCALQAVDNGSA